MKEIGRLKHRDDDGEEVLVVYRARYATGNLAIVVKTDQGEEYATVSENHHPHLALLGPNEFAVQTRNMTSRFVCDLLASGLFEVVDMVKFGPFGTVEQIWRLKS